MKPNIVELEHLEGILDAWNGRRLIVRVPLHGGIQLAFLGTFTSQLDLDANPQFVVTRQDFPSPGLVFYGKDVAYIINPAGPEPQIVLKKDVDTQTPVE